MAQQRRYVVTSTAAGPAFDGITAFPGPWSPASNVGSYATNNQKFNLFTSGTRLGRFTPADFGSTKNPARLVRVYSNGPFTAGDQYLVRSSANATLGQPVSIVREAARPLQSSMNDAVPLLVGPTDDLCITMQGNGTAASVHILVDDLSEAEWAVINAELIGAAAAGTAPTFETRILTAPSVLASWVGTLFVSGLATTAGDSFTLPALADVPIGARLIFFRRSDVTGRWFNLVPNGVETINGTALPLRFSAEGQGITLERTAAGWSANATVDEGSSVAVLGNAALAVPYRQRTRIEWTLNQAGNGSLTLPALANVAIGQTFLISLMSIAGGAIFGSVVPTGGENIDGVVNKALSLGRAGDSVVIERVPAGWVSTSNGILTIETRALTVNAGPVDIVAWTVNTLYVEARGTVAGGTLRLPAIASIPLGGRVRIARTDGGVASEHFVLIANGVETINASTSPIRFAFDAMGVWLERDANGWIASQAPDNTNTIALGGTQVLTRTGQLRRLIEWTPGSGTTLTLPAIATMAIDQEIEVMAVNVTGTGGTVIPTAGEQLDSVVNKPIQFVRTGDTAIFRRTPTGGWLCYGRFTPLNQDSIPVVADPALGASAGWDGLRHYRCTYAAPGNFTLPTAPKLGTEIVISQANANAVTLQAGANVIIAGGTAIATLALAINAPIHLIFTTGAWVQL